MAIAPWFEHARLLRATISKATAVLKAPIDRIWISSGKVLFWARSKYHFWPGTRKLTISYRYVANPSNNLGASPHLLLDGEDADQFEADVSVDRAALSLWRRREVLLNAAITKATYNFHDAPIDYIEVTSDKILFRAGTKELTISYQYVEKSGEHPKSAGFLLDGEDYWECLRP